MNKSIRTAFFATPIAVALVCSTYVARSAAPATPQGFITERDYYNLNTANGVAISGLTNNAKFPNSPDLVIYPSLFELFPNADTSTTPGGNPRGLADYGSEISGYFYPPTSGPYTFYVCSDDNGSLYLSTDENPANKHLIAAETVWSNPREYLTSAGASSLSSKRSDQYTGTTWPTGTNITLVAGQAYYIQALFKEGGGGDNLSVSINGTNPIPGTMLSTIDRISATAPYSLGVVGHGGGFYYTIQEIGGGSQVTLASIQVTLNGNVVTANNQRIADKVFVAYLAPSPYLAVGSTNSVILSFTDNASFAQSYTNQFVVGPYATIPGDYSVASASTPGFNLKMYQMNHVRGPGDANAIGAAEEQFSHGFIDPNTSLPYPNVAFVDNTTVSGFINWNVNPVSDFDGQNDPSALDAGNWQAATPPLPDPYNIADDHFPGLPGTGNDPGAPGVVWDNFVDEITTYLQLSPGFYRMGVNSDDGFKVTTAPGVSNPFGLVLGSFNGGRGSSDTLFDFVVTNAGYFPFRLLHWQGNGGGNLEWFTVNLSTTEKVLVNETSPSVGVPAFQTPSPNGRAYVKTLLPADGFVGAITNQVIKAELQDDRTAVVAGSIQLWVDGIQVTPTIASAAGTTTVTYPAGTPYGFTTMHTNVLVWGENTTPQTTWTNTFTFTVRQYSPDDLPSYTQGSFWIEAEDFDSTGNPIPAAVNAMPYAGNAYNNVSAVFNVDYGSNDGVDTAIIYRTGLTNAGNNMDMVDNLGGQYGANRPGGFLMTTDYRIGWADTGDWGNYTRTIPNGTYTANAALSHDTSGGLTATLGKVTAGVGTLNQTVVPLGTFNGPTSGAWGANNLVPLFAADGSLGVFKITSSPTTLRFTMNSGDFDWFVLTPVAGVTPKVTASSPANGTQVRRDATLNFTIEDFSTAVDINSVKLIFDGVDVTSTATKSKAADITTVSFDPPGLMNIASTHTYSLIYSDNGTPVKTQTNTASFFVHIYPTPNSFLIEAEDFNFGGGQHQTAADTMPYLGGAYSNLGAVFGVDYNDNDGADSVTYRPPLTNLVNGVLDNVNMDANASAGTLDVDRGEWNVTSNYKIGWVGVGDWFNYTRNIPANSYQVWAALSHDPNDTMRASLSQVTSDPTQTNQTVVTLGTFNAPTSGAWGDNNLVQMQSGGSAAVVSLSGVQTLRFNGDSGDYDYFVLVPSALPLKFTSATVSGGQLTINWVVPPATPTPVLQQATVLTGSPTDWSPVTPAPAGTSYSVAVGTTGQKFFRLSQ